MKAAYEAAEKAAYNAMSAAEKAKIDEMRKEKDLLIEEIADHGTAIWCLFEFRRGRTEESDTGDGPADESGCLYYPTLEEELEYCRSLVKRIRSNERIELPHIDHYRY